MPHCSLQGSFTAWRANCAAFASLSQLTGLQQLTLHAFHCPGAHLAAAVRQMRQLEVLQLSGRVVLDPLGRALTALTRLHRLELTQDVQVRPGGGGGGLTEDVQLRGEVQMMLIAGLQYRTVRYGTIQVSTGQYSTGVLSCLQAAVGLVAGRPAERWGGCLPRWGCGWLLPLQQRS
jgi:hypothetical protein